MVTKGDKNMLEVNNDYNVINSYIFLGTRSEASVHGHEIFKTEKLIGLVLMWKS
jgi:hypothetical protein